MEIKFYQQPPISRWNAQSLQVYIYVIKLMALWYRCDHLIYYSILDIWNISSLKGKGEAAESDHRSAASPVLSSYSGKRGPPLGKTEDRPRGESGTLANLKACVLHCRCYWQKEPDFFFFFFGFMVFLDEEWVLGSVKVNASLSDPRHAGLPFTCPVVLLNFCWVGTSLVMVLPLEAWPASPFISVATLNFKLYSGILLI